MKSDISVKRIICFLLAVMMLLAAVGCKESKKSNKKKVVVRDKVIVRDNGQCIPGEFCEPIIGTMDREFIGIAKPAEKESKQPKFYVLERVSSHSILILNNALTNICNAI